MPPERVEIHQANQFNCWTKHQQAYNCQGVLFFIQLGLACICVSPDLFYRCPKSALFLIRHLGYECIVCIGFINQAGVIGIGFLLPFIDHLDTVVKGINTALLNNRNHGFSAATTGTCYIFGIMATRSVIPTSTPDCDKSVVT